MKNKKRRPGFTLVEMVIVVTILGILASLGFAKFGQVQESARLNADYVAASSLATAANLAVSDGEIKLATGEEIDIKTQLLDKGYLSVEPKPQSEGDEFIMKIDDKKNIVVEAGGKQLYPKKEKGNVGEQ